MRYVIELFIWLFIMFMNVNMCQDIGVQVQKEEAAFTSLEAGGSVDGHFEGIWGDKESRCYKLSIPENTGSKRMAFWIANYADSPVRCSLLDENGQMLDKEIRILANSRKIIPAGTGGSFDSEGLYRLLPGRTYYIKIEKQFFPARGRYVILFLDILDNDW